MNATSVTLHSMKLGKFKMRAASTPMAQPETETEMGKDDRMYIKQMILDRIDPPI